MTYMMQVCVSVLQTKTAWAKLFPLRYQACTNDFISVIIKWVCLEIIRKIGPIHQKRHAKSKKPVPYVLSMERCAQDFFH